MRSTSTTDRIGVDYKNRDDHKNYLIKARYTAVDDTDGQ